MRALRRRRAGAWLACLMLTGAVAPAGAAGQVRIVVAGPASGARAAETEAVLAAVRTEAGSLNAQGGVLGLQLGVAFVDDGCDGGKAAEAARKVAAEQPALVIGHVCSNAAIVAAREYAAARILFITPGARHRDITERRAGPTIFRLAGRDDLQGAFTGAWLREHFSGRRIALVSDRTAYARRLTDDVRAALAAAQPPPLVAAVVAGDKDYAALVTQLRAAGAEAVYYAGFAIEAAVILRQLRAAGSTVAFVVADAAGSDEFVSLAGSAIDGAAIVAPADGGAAKAATALRAGAAVHAWRNAVVAAGMVAAEPVAVQLQKLSSETAALGALSFTTKGDAVLPSYAVLTCRAGTDATLAAACRAPASPPGGAQR